MHARWRNQLPPCAGAGTHHASRITPHASRLTHHAPRFASRPPGGSFAAVAKPVPNLALKLLLLAVLAVAWAPRVAGAPSPGLPNLAVHRWAREDGLPDDHVTAVLQTRDGFLWVGTQSGLARFDGAQFRVLPPPAARPGLPCHVTALCEDAQGRLWIGTQGQGLLCAEAGQTTATPAAGGGPAESVTSVASGRGGELWVGTPAGLGQLANGAWQWFTTRDGLPHDFVSGVHAARSGTVWVTTRGGMCQFRSGRVLPLEFQTESSARSPEFLGVYEDRRGVLWAFGDTYLVNLGDGKRFNYFRGGEAPAVRIWSLSEGRNGQLWIGTSGQGVFSFAEGKFLPLTLREGRLSSDVRALCEDRAGNLWLGTHGGGLLRLQPQRGRLLGRDAGLPPGPAQALAFTPDGRLWAGFEQGGLLVKTAGDRFTNDGDAGRFAPQNLIAALAAAPDGSLWIGTAGVGLWRLNESGVVRFSTADGLPDDALLALAVEPDGTLWAAPRAGGVARLGAEAAAGFAPVPGLPRAPVTALTTATAGGVWAGTAGGEIYRGGATGFRKLEPTALSGQAVRALHTDAEGRLWIGTAGGGLGVLAGEKFVRWDTTRGFPDNWVVGLLSDAAGNLWFSSPKGVWRIAHADLLALGTEPPPTRRMFESTQPASAAAAGGGPGAARGPDGQLWFALADGLVALAPEGLELAAPVPVFIEEVRVNGEPVPPSASPGGPLRLPANLRSLEIQFTALELSAPESVRCQHKLEGFDADWVDGGTERRARYGRLPSGDYRFRLRTGEGHGSAGNAALALVLPAPFWRGPFALLLYGLGATVAVASAARLVSHRRLRTKLARLAQQQAMQRERMRIAQDMHDEIGSKLTKISYLSERAQGELGRTGAAADKLETIANTSRELLQSLDEIVWAVNPHNDTLEHLAAYLGQYASEYLQNTAVECELHIPRGLPDRPLSSETRHNLFLAFEEALNNVLKHSGATKVRVEMAVTPGRFGITLTDDGRGFDARAPAHRARGGNGLVNLRQRLADVGGQCLIRSAPGEGACVTLDIPLP